MFEAGRSSFEPFSSNKTFPVSSETTLTAISAGANSGLRSTSVILLCNSARVFVEFAVFGFGATATGDANGDAAGIAAGGGVGEGTTVGEATGAGAVLRSR